MDLLIFDIPICFARPWEGLGNDFIKGEEGWSSGLRVLGLTTDTASRMKPQKVFRSGGNVIPHFPQFVISNTSLVSTRNPTRTCLSLSFRFDGVILQSSNPRLVDAKCRISGYTMCYSAAYLLNKDRSVP